MQSIQERQFREQWPVCLEAMEDLYGNGLLLASERFEQVHERLQNVRQRATTNEIERALRQLWSFDERFFGELIGFRAADYEWAVYSLCYLCKEEEVIDHLLKMYVPLLGRYIQESLGSDFRSKVGSTFMDDVGHVLWDVEGLSEPEDHGLFDWHANRNDLPLERIERFLNFADLQTLANPDFPPSWVMIHFTNLQNPFDSEGEYLDAMQEFYWDKGYSINL